MNKILQNEGTEAGKQILGCETSFSREYNIELHQKHPIKDSQMSHPLQAATIVSVF